MEHSGTESDKAVSIPPDVVPATSTTTVEEPSISPPDTTASADHEAIGDASADVVDAVTTQQTQEPGEILNCIILEGPVRNLEFTILCGVFTWTPFYGVVCSFITIVL